VSLGLVHAKVIGVQSVYARLLLSAESSKNEQKLVRNGERVLADTRDLKVSARNAGPNFGSEVKHVKVVEVANFVPASKQEHKVSMNSGTESASWGRNASRAFGRDFPPGFGLEVKLVEIVQVFFPGESSKDIHRVSPDNSRVAGSFSWGSSFDLNGSPVHRQKVQAVDVVEPGSGESIPASEGEKVVLVNECSEGGSLGKGSARSRDWLGLVGFGIESVQVVGVIETIVASDEVQRAIVRDAFVFRLATHLMLQGSPFSRLDVLNEEVGLDVGDQIGHESLGSMASIDVQLLFVHNGRAPQAGIGSTGRILLHKQASPQ